MTIVYFDRNVFADICELRRGLTVDNVATIQHAVDGGSITIPASSVVIEETISLLIDSEETYRRHMKTVLDLIDKERMIKKHSQLTEEDCLSYAFNQPMTNRLRRIPGYFRDVLELKSNRNDLENIASETRTFYEKMAEGIQRGLEKS